MLINVYLKKKYCEGLYDFIIQQNKHIFINKNEHQDHYSYHYKYFGAFDKNDINNAARAFNHRGIIKKINTKDDFVAEISEQYSYHIEFYDDKSASCDNNLFQYVKQFIYDNSIYHQEIMNKYASLVNHRLDKDLLAIIKDSPDKKIAISLLKQAPISDITVNFATPQQLEEILLDKNISEQELNDFFMIYYKKRKNQIKQPKFAPLLRDYLLERFDRDERKIEPYFEFFPFIKSYFYSNEIDVFEDCAPSSVVTYFNTKKMISAYSLDGWVANDYYSAAEKFVNGFIKYFDKENGFGYIDTADKPKGIYIVVITHLNPNINKDMFQQLFNTFFNYLYTEQKFALSENSVATWISQHLLKNSLENGITEENKPKKNKI